MPQCIALRVGEHLRIEAGRMIGMVGQLDRRDQAIAEALESPLEEHGEIRVGQPNKRPPQDEAIDQIDAAQPPTPPIMICRASAGGSIHQSSASVIQNAAAKPGQRTARGLGARRSGVIRRRKLRQQRVDLRSERAARGAARMPVARGFGPRFQVRCKYLLVRHELLS